MQLLLNCRGLRVDFQELQGLFSKNGTLTGTFGQRSSDRDPSAQTRSVREVGDALPPATKLVAARLMLTGVRQSGGYSGYLGLRFGAKEGARHE